MSISSQYSVQKRRADTLETLSAVLKEARPQCYIAVSIELLRELAEVHLELMGLNLRRLYLAQPDSARDSESKDQQSQFFSEFSENTLHKMEAIADIHQCLDQCSENLGHGALGDFEVGVPNSSAAHEASDEAGAHLFDSYQSGDVELF